MIIFYVRGAPAPQGSKRHVGHGRMVESSKAVGPWREAVRAEAQNTLAGAPPLIGPVLVVIEFRLPRPKSHHGARGVLRSAPALPSGRPDLDKLVRAVLDGITDASVITDDAQVCSLVASKRWANPLMPQGATIRIEAMT